jgi:hypothetical protein
MTRFRELRDRVKRSRALSHSTERIYWHEEQPPPHHLEGGLVDWGGT